MTNMIEIDARGYRCPMPVLKLRRALDDAPPGTIIRLIATDPVALKDVPAFCREVDVEITSQKQGKDCFWFEVKSR